MLQYLDGWAQRLNLDTSLEHCLRWSPNTSCETMISSRSFWGQTLHNRCHKDDIGNHKSQQSKHVPLKSQHKRSTWTMSPDLLGGHIYLYLLMPSCMMVFASKMPTLRAFRALLKSFKKLGEVVSTSVWHHMQGLGPPDHVLDVRLMAHRECKWLISNLSQHCAKWDNKDKIDMRNVHMLHVQKHGSIEQHSSHDTYSMTPFPKLSFEGLLPGKNMEEIQQREVVIKLVS